MKTLWGVGAVEGNAPDGYPRLFSRLVAEGWQAVECPVWRIADKAKFCAALSAAGLGYVAMINTCTPSAAGGGAAEPRPAQDLESHIASFEAQVAECLALPLRPLLINAHSGCDLWPAATARAFFQRALAVEAASGILIAHETHRGRILYNAWATRDMLREFPALHVTADLSHFVVVAERVFHDADEDWAACMKEIARACRHIHARVGYAQGPQAPDPRAPEYAEALAAHEAWWRAIEDAQAAAGTQLLTVEPEHGTDGYQQRLPYSTVETADIWAVNAWLRERCETRHRAAPWFEK